MLAGRRNQRLQFIRAEKAQNASGEDITTWTHLAFVWARIEALAGRELEAAQQTWAEARFRITIDHPLSSFTPRREDRIMWGSPARILDILDSEDQTNHRRTVLIHAKEYVY